MLKATGRATSKKLMVVDIKKKNLEDSIVKESKKVKAIKKKRGDTDDEDEEDALKKIDNKKQKNRKGREENEEDARRKMSKEERLNSLLRLAYVLNEPYPGSYELKFVDKVIGNRGGQNEGSIDNIKALSKASQVFTEVESLMKSNPI